MPKIQKGLLLAVVFALMFAVVPLALAQDQPPQPPPPTPDPNVTVNINAPWGTILLIAVGALVLVALIGLAGRGTETHTIERVEDHHHHDTV